MKPELQSTKVKRYQLVFKIGVTLLILIYLYTSVSAADITDTFLAANGLYLTAGILLVVPNIGLQFYKWKILCGELLGITSSRRILVSLFYGFSGGIATPFRIGEYVGRAMALDEKGFIEVSAATLIDKLFVLLGVAIAGVFSFIYFLQVYFGLPLLPAVFLHAAALLVLVFLFPVLRRIENRPGVMNKLKTVKYLGEFISSLLSFKNLTKKTVVKLIIITLILCCVYISQFALFAYSYSGKNSFYLYFWAGLLVMFTKTFIPPITLGELGVREGASVFFLARLNESTAVALNTSLSLFTINILLTSLAGMVLVIMRRNRKT